MSLKLATDTRDAMVQQLQVLLDAGSAPGVIKIYSGTQPVDPSTNIAAANKLLATLTFDDPAAPSASAGKLTMADIVEDTAADQDGTATWFRAEDSDGNAVFDGSVSKTGDGGTIEFKTNTFVKDVEVVIEAFEVELPQG